MKKLKEYLTATLILILFLIVASDGDYFPWANFGALFGLAGVVEAIT
ncbi:MAG: hypothetical protein WC450_12830 [Candidatus Omnitrophota bacterium]|jgi:hypothetical protein